MASVLKTLAPITVGTTAVQLFSAPFPKIQSIYFRCPTSNTANIFVGDSSVDASVQRGICVKPDNEKAITGDAGSGGGAQVISADDIWADSTSAAQTLIVCYIEKVG